MGGRFVIRRYHPLRPVLLGAALVGVGMLGALVLCLWPAPRTGLPLVDALRGGPERGECTELEPIRERLAQALAEGQDAKERLVRMERAAEVDRAAYDQISQTLRGGQAEALDLREELAFYQHLVEGKGSKGLEVHGLRLSPGTESGGYRFKLVLTRGDDGEALAEGTVELVVSGRSGGQDADAALEDLSAETLSFQFQFFQRLQGQLAIPEGFVPAKVAVVVKPKDNPKGRLERVYDWSALLG